MVFNFIYGFFFNNKKKNKNTNNSSDFTGYSTDNFGTWRFGFRWSQVQLVPPMLW
jgi:hypothetical protein